MAQEIARADRRPPPWEAICFRPLCLIKEVSWVDRASDHTPSAIFRCHGEHASSSALKFPQQRALSAASRAGAIGTRFFRLPPSFPAERPERNNPLQAVPFHPSSCWLLFVVPPSKAKASSSLHSPFQS